MKPYFATLIFIKSFLCANQSCLILLDQRDIENISRPHSYYLTTKLQSALTEKTVPILLHTSLWNTFIERRDLAEEKTPFDPSDWSIYKKSGFYLFIPKLSSTSGFKVESLDPVAEVEDSAINFFESQNGCSLPIVLSAIFSPDSDKWDIVLSGHGGSLYEEWYDDQKLSWMGQPLISDLKLNEFKQVLDFFQTRVATHLFHYSSCFSGGNHIVAAFDRSYNYAIICDCLTDCATYCKVSSPYNWTAFFDTISTIDFSSDNLDTLQSTLDHITHPIIANIAQVRLPGATQFYPLTDDSQQVHLLDTTHLDSLTLNNTENVRIISIIPGKATHYIGELTLTNPADLLSVFWQAEFQLYDKTFLIDTCFINNTTLRNVLIKQQNCFDGHFIRLFYTLDDKSHMLVGKNTDEYQLKPGVTLLIEQQLSPESRLEYEQTYANWSSKCR